MTPALRIFLRKGLNRFCRQVLRIRSRPLPVVAGSTAILFSPHPDDDVLGCGGLLIQRGLTGAATHVAYLTDGSASHPGHPVLDAGGVADQRRREAAAGAGILGLAPANLHFLGAADGTLDHLSAAEAGRLRGLISGILSEVRPDEIYLPCRRDGSSEHDAAFILVREALDSLSLTPRVLEFPVWSWWDSRRLAGPALACRRVWRADVHGHRALKQRALEAHASQVKPVPPWTDPVLGAEFVSFFLSGEEFFLQM